MKLSEFLPSGDNRGRFRMTSAYTRVVHSEVRFAWSASGSALTAQWEQTLEHHRSHLVPGDGCLAHQQLQAYVAWVNSQLKKRPAVKPVQDLRQDLRDGVILAYLIEIVAGEKLSGVQLSPSNQQEMKNNVEKVLQFVASKKIRMHQTSAKDIVDGNLKSIMRLVLALAAHFKPGSSRTVNQGRDSRAPLQNHRPHCATAVAQGAAAALADVCHDMSRSGRDVFRYRQRNSSMDEEIENPYWSVRALVQQYEGQQRSPSESSCSSLTSASPIHSAKSESIITQSEEKADFVIIPSEGIETRTEETESPLSRDWRPGSPGTYLETSWEEQLLEQQEYLEKEMEEAKKMISGLQALLLNGSLPEDEQERPLAFCEPVVNPEEQLIIIQSRLDQSMEENQDLKYTMDHLRSPILFRDKKHFHYYPWGGDLSPPVRCRLSQALRTAPVGWGDSPLVPRENCVRRRWKFCRTRESTWVRAGRVVSSSQDSAPDRAPVAFHCLERPTPRDGPAGTRHSIAWLRGPRSARTPTLPDPRPAGEPVWYAMDGKGTN
ncbi:dixin-like [Rhinopithecus roxellana]|uniref:dixin-like n=1 Tax=Rhinopithecus roxellana TaxID=61622 RepID=UPI0012376447|nr:dixin-like [Rhinopithecus roxellana]